MKNIPVMWVMGIEDIDDHIHWREVIAKYVGVEPFKIGWVTLPKVNTFAETPVMFFRKNYNEPYQKQKDRVAPLLDYLER